VSADRLRSVVAEGDFAGPAIIMKDEVLQERPAYYGAVKLAAGGQTNSGELTADRTILFRNVDLGQIDVSCMRPCRA
jgi:hypothetical protein